MPKRFRSEEIIHKLREADVLSAQGRTVAEIVRQWGVTELTRLSWSRSYDSHEETGPCTKRFRSEEIIHKLREADVRREAAPVAEIVRQWGVTEQTYFRWRKEYGGLKIDQARRLKDLEQENARLSADRVDEKNPRSDQDTDR